MKRAQRTERVNKRNKGSERAQQSKEMSPAEGSMHTSDQMIVGERANDQKGEGD